MTREEFKEQIEVWISEPMALAGDASAFYARDVAARVLAASDAETRRMLGALLSTVYIDGDD